MLRLPMPATDDLKLTDWLELYALISPDGNASYVDLERTLRREGVFGPENDEDIERLILDVALELDRRALGADRAYPFEFSERGLQLRGDLEQFVPYVFCLCLSASISNSLLNRRPYPRRMFEHLSCAAAKNFIGGEVVRFASPRQATELPPEFDLAVNALCNRIREGIGFREKDTSASKDDAIDVVAWRDFPDRAEGKLLLIGNCASGNNWNAKLDELQFQLFCENWMVEIPVSAHIGIRAFFVPCRICSKDWQKVSRRAGMIFDRCRIAYWASASDDFPDKQNYLDWTRRTLSRVTA